VILTLALLGALKHWRRSLMVLVAVATASSVMVVVGGLLGGISESFYEGLATGAGHVRVRSAAAARAVDPLGLDSLLPDAESLAARIREGGGGEVLAAEPVLAFGALLVEKAADEVAEPRNLAMRCLGVAPDTRFAEGPKGGTEAGSFLPAGKGVFLSEAAARLLRVRLGEGILVLVQDSGGNPWYEELPVTGLFSTESADFDETTFYMAAGKAGEMLDVQGSARELRILLRDRNDAPALASRLSKELGAGIEVSDWRGINASMLSFLVIIKCLLGFVLLLFALVAGTIVTNTVLMSVMERMREFGTMRAIGMKARELRRLVSLEGAILGLAGAALGRAHGAAAVGALSPRGIDLGGIMENLGLSRYNRPAPSAAWYLACALSSVLVGWAAASRAAAQAARTGVAESLASIR
jgi:putative ABC transport system permease protein